MKATKKQNFDKKKRIVIILLILIIITGLMIIFTKPKRLSSSRTEKSTINTKSTPKSDPYTGRLIVDKYPNENILWYHVTLNTNVLSNGINGNPPLLAEDVLPDLFELPMVKEPLGGAFNVIEKIVYDTQLSYPYQGGTKDGAMYRQYNSSFYIAIKGFTLDMTKTYRNNYAQAILSYVDPILIPYLKNKDFCNKDSDCMIRDSFCGYGSFNKYETYLDIYGCESPPYDLETVDTAGQPIFYEGQQYDPTLKCYVKAHYAGTACINNQCKGTGRTLACVNN